jgi:hypothetical protein
LSQVHWKPLFIRQSRLRDGRAASMRARAVVDRCENLTRASSWTGQGKRNGVSTSQATVSLCTESLVASNDARTHVTSAEGPTIGTAISRKSRKCHLMEPNSIRTPGSTPCPRRSTFLVSACHLDLENRSFCATDV